MGDFTLSGHSKWHNIKLRKGKVDAQRGALFTKISKEIILAAKSGSPDPEANYRLKMAVEKARENNMPQDNIKRAISRANGSEAKEIEELRYEGYGPSGVAVVVDAATDNKNRTASELRYVFSRNGGTFGETGTVAWMFDAAGIIEIDPQGKSEDAFTEACLIEGVVDVEFGDPASVYTEPTSVTSTRDALHSAGLKIKDAHLGMRPKTKIAPSGEELSAALQFLDALEDHEDVQRVFSNVELTDAALEALV
ncbi:MAG: YebC/PmpR family DNA-binding transcriptional regulator [Candidatus Eremiobacteraeota bacterium]|nr:YebC/PmpR family DNA-binding transcriptional regulator [Candidatus Eremiobacteraeota bacterium]